jgi:hypothetical protein
MASPSPSKKSTNQFMRQGHTSGPFGNEPNRDAKGQAGEPAKEIKP